MQFVGSHLHKYALKLMEEITCFLFQLLQSIYIDFEVSWFVLGSQVEQFDSIFDTMRLTITCVVA